tara:strand:- start:2199 stop:3029 length:831 start_codon:yes stop_codon:yes gene_type:complete
VSIRNSGEVLLGRVEGLLSDMGPFIVAVSGGVDSMILAIIAHRSSSDARIVHAVSPAVPFAATERVRFFGNTEGWTVDEINAGEFLNADYIKNPVNRCYYCKTHLYRAIATHSFNSDKATTILSGTNIDDLSDYRPGLHAAQEYNVRHPYVEVGIDKAAVRTLATILEFPSLAALPASPCLSSRVETGLPIESKILSTIDEIETMLRDELKPETVRFRYGSTGFVVELDKHSLERLAVTRKRAVLRKIEASLQRSGLEREEPVRFSVYKMGNSFRH